MKNILIYQQWSWVEWDETDVARMELMLKLMQYQPDYVGCDSNTHWIYDILRMYVILRIYDILRIYNYIKNI